MTSTLLQQAVEALKEAERVIQGTQAAMPCPSSLALVRSALSALQQQPEPVAVWQSQCKDGTWVDCDEANARAGERYGFPARVLYTAPPALQQQEEPRERIKVGELILPGINGEEYDDPETLTLGKVLEALQERLVRNSHDRILDMFVEVRAASPSPQDFTLPMVEERKGTDGVAIPRPDVMKLVSEYGVCRYSEGVAAMSRDPNLPPDTAMADNAKTAYENIRAALGVAVPRHDPTSPRTTDGGAA